jgi:hypothetical protein
MPAIRQRDGSHKGRLSERPPSQVETGVTDSPLSAVFFRARRRYASETTGSACAKIGVTAPRNDGAKSTSAVVPDKRARAALRAALARADPGPITAGGCWCEGRCDEHLARQLKPVVMGPRFCGDDSGDCGRSRVRRAPRYALTPCRRPARTGSRRREWCG